MNKSHLTDLLTYLKTHDYISPVVYRAVFQRERLAARIRDLRARGVLIRTAQAEDFEGKRYTRYSLVQR